MACFEIQLYVILNNNIFPAVYVDITNKLLKNNRYTYYEPEDGFYGAFVNNSWNGMVRMIIDDVSSL